MFCIYCGTRLPIVARFCRVCGRPVEDAADEGVLPAAADAAQLVEASGRPSVAAGVALEGIADEKRAAKVSPELGRLAEWPEHFVGEVLSLMPDLGEDERYALERACRAHVDSVMGSVDEVDLQDLARKLEASPGGGSAAQAKGPRSALGYDPD
jgi:hypothetical protein